LAPSWKLILKFLSRIRFGLLWRFAAPSSPAAACRTLRLASVTRCRVRGLTSRFARELAPWMSQSNIYEAE